MILRMNNNATTNVVRYFETRQRVAILSEEGATVARGTIRETRDDSAAVVLDDNRGCFWFGYAELEPVYNSRGERAFA